MIQTGSFSFRDKNTGKYGSINPLFRKTSELETPEPMITKMTNILLEILKEKQLKGEIK